MATATMSNVVPTPAGVTPNDDPFHDPLLFGIGIVFVIVAVAILALTGLMHWGVMYHAPSWSAHSFPPPIVH